MAAPKNEPDTPEKPDAEAAPGAQTAPSDKPTPKKPTHKNSYGDPVYVRDDLHTFVEARGYTRL